MPKMGNETLGHGTAARFPLIFGRVSAGSAVVFTMPVSWALLARRAICAFRVWCGTGGWELRAAVRLPVSRQASIYAGDPGFYSGCSAPARRLASPILQAFSCATPAGSGP